jgi:hypothetical protein
MNYHRFLAVGGILSLGLVLAPGGLADEATTDLAAQIRKLSSKQYPERENAEEALKQLPQALAVLESQISKLDAEGRQRAQRIIELLKEEAANLKRIEAEKIYLKYTDTPISKILADLTVKSGIVFELSGTGVAYKNKKISLDTGERPFWLAFEQFLQVAGLAESVPPAIVNQPQQYEYSGQVVRYYGPGSRSGGRKGTITLEAGKSTYLFDSRHSVRVGLLPPNSVGHSRRTGTDEVTLALCFLPPASVQIRSVLGVEVTSAVDSSRQVLKSKMTRNPFLGMRNPDDDDGLNVNVNLAMVEPEPLAGTGMAILQYPLTLLQEKPEAKLAKLEGKLHLLCVGRDEAIMNIPVSDKLDEKSHGLANFSFKITSLEKDSRGNYTIQALYESIGAGSAQVINGGDLPPAALQRVGDFDFSESNSVPKLIFVDAKGKTFTRTDTRVVQQNFQQGPLGDILKSEMLLTVMGAKDLGDLKEIRLVGKRLTQMSIPFQFANVELPK